MAADVQVDVCFHCLRVPGRPGFPMWGLGLILRSRTSCYVTTASLLPGVMLQEGLTGRLPVVLLSEVNNR